MQIPVLEEEAGDQRQQVRGCNRHAFEAAVRYCREFLTLKFVEILLLYCK